MFNIDKGKIFDKREDYYSGFSYTEIKQQKDKSFTSLTADIDSYLGGRDVALYASTSQNGF